MFKKLIPLLFLFAGFQVNASLIGDDVGTAHIWGHLTLGTDSATVTANSSDAMSPYLNDYYTVDVGGSATDEYVRLF